MMNEMRKLIETIEKIDESDEHNEELFGNALVDLIYAIEVATDAAMDDADEKRLNELDAYVATANAKIGKAHSALVNAARKNLLAAFKGHDSEVHRITGS